MIKSEKHRKYETQVGSLRSYIEAVARSRVKDYRDVEDTAQIVLLKAWKAFDQLPEAEDVLKKWLSVVVERAVADYYRLRARQCETHDILDLTGTYVDLPDEALIPLSVCETVYFPDPFVLPAVNLFLEGLSPTHREVLLLSVENKSYDQIATETGATIGTVRSRLYYARRKARRALASYLWLFD